MVFTIPSLLHFLLLSFLCSRKCSRKWPKGDCQNMGLCRQAIRYIQRKIAVKPWFYNDSLWVWRLNWLPCWSPLETLWRYGRDSDVRFHNVSSHIRITANNRKSETYIISQYYKLSHAISIFGCSFGCNFKCLLNYEYQEKYHFRFGRP